MYKRFSPYLLALLALAALSGRAQLPGTPSGPAPSSESIKEIPQAGKSEALTLTRIEAVASTTELRRLRALRGGSDTGGGNVCVGPNKTHTLLEFVTLNPHRHTGDKLVNTDLMEAAGIDYLPLFHQTRAARIVAMRLNSLKLVYPAVGSELLGMFRTLTFFSTGVRINRPVQVSPERRLDCDGDIVAGALFAKVQEGRVILSLPVYNELDLSSQVGLLLHETLRAFQFSRRVLFTNYELESFVVDLFTRDFDRPLAGILPTPGTMHSEFHMKEDFFLVQINAVTSYAKLQHAKVFDATLAGKIRPLLTSLLNDSVVE